MRRLVSRYQQVPARWRVALVGAYLAALLPVLMFFNVGLTPDSLLFVLLGAALLLGRPVLFVRDWGVFLLVVILWQQTGPVAKWVGFPLHMTQLVAIDRAIAWPLLHGALPQVWLQQHLFHPGYTVRTHYHAGYWQGHVYHRAWWDHVTYPTRWQWYDILSWAVYALHFPEPLLVGFAIWLRTRAGFRRFSVAFLVLAALAFVGYIVYPAVPPWMAFSKYHAIGPVDKIFSLFNDQVLLGRFGHQYKHVLDVRYNLTGAMPSLHAAFPVLSALYLRKTFGRWGLLMLGYAAIVWFAVVYMAEHWIVDVAVGVALTMLAYALVEGVAAAWAARARRREATKEAAAAAMSALSHKAGAGR